MESYVALLLCELDQCTTSTDRHSDSDHNAVPHTVRVVGRVSFFDPLQRVCQLEDQGSYVMVDLSLVSMHMIKVDHLVQVLGSLQPSSSGKAGIKAKILRPVDGLDMHLYRESLSIRRTFMDHYVT